MHEELSMPGVLFASFSFILWLVRDDGMESFHPYPLASAIPYPLLLLAADSGELTASSLQLTTIHSIITPMSSPKLVSLLILLTCLLSGCVTLTDLQTAQEQSQDNLAILEPGQIAGQTFQAHRAGLRSIAIWLGKPDGSQTSPTVSASLLYTSSDDQPLASKTFTVTNNGPYYLTFSPLHDPPDQTYYLRLTSGSPVSLLGSKVDVYTQGSAFLDNQPLPGDLAFRTTYDYRLASLLGDLTAAIPYLWLALPLGILLLAPGWLVLDLLTSGRRWQTAEEQWKGERGEGFNLAQFTNPSPKQNLASPTPDSSPKQSTASPTLNPSPEQNPASPSPVSSSSSSSLPQSPPPDPPFALYGLSSSFTDSQFPSVFPPSAVGGLRSFLAGLRSESKRSSWIFGSRVTPNPSPEQSSALPSPTPFSSSSLLNNLDGGTTIAISLGLSLGLVALVMLWTTIFHLHWSLISVLVGFGLIMALALWRLWIRLPSLHISWTSIGLVAIFLVTLVVRFEMSRDLAGPSWVDSVHHALLTRLVLLNGGNPASLSPYLNIPPTQYHAGYHSGLASFIWLSGLQLPQAMLIYGQVLSALAIFPAYLLGTLLTKDPRVGLLAALITGIFSPMPAYYTSWGRYTQLAGLLVFPAILPFIWKLLESDQWSQIWRSALLVILGAAGLLLVHYRVAVFLATLLLADFLSRLFWKEMPLSLLLRRWARIIISGAISILLVLPWMLPDFQLLLRPSTSDSTNAAATPRFFVDFAWPLLTTASGKYILYLAGAGLVLAILFRKRFWLTLAAWIVSLFFLANLGAMHLPLGWFINNTSVEIMLFLPLSVLAGDFLVELLALLHSSIPEPSRKFFPAAATLVLIGLSWWGAVKLLPIINSGTAQLRAGDEPALAWIDTHLPGDATILINPFYWGNGLYAGSDGGYWISPLTGRQTLPPPVLYGFGTRQDVQAINTVVKQVLDYATDPDTLWQIMQDQHISYVYTGVKGGPLSSSVLLSSPKFHLLHATGGTYLFQTIP